MPPTITRDEMWLRAEALPVVAELLRTKLRAPATLLALVFEQPDADECIRGYVAWERADQCGTHAFTLHLRATRHPRDAEREPYYVLTNPPAPHMLYGGAYDMPSACEALADLADRAKRSH